MVLRRYILLFLRFVSYLPIVYLFLMYVSVIDEIHNQWVREKSPDYPYVFSKKGDGFVYMSKKQHDTRLKIFGEGAVAILIGAIIWNIPLNKQKK